ncbi:MAG: hypothetical protein NZ992_01400, partial [Candidatus Korarchaeum sp.]|nr:hypothetical protein [Candidatus Korarchaeum sp.]MDW8036169.1 hypothetical protein [Candidatus Korarchaeum sp.]
MRRGLLTFLIVSFSLAALIDFTFFSRYQQMSQIEAQIYVTLWGLARMYTPTLGAVASLLLTRESVKSSMISYLNVSRTSLKYFLLSPLMIYFAVGLFFLSA